MRVIAGSLSVLLGLGFGLPCLIGVRHFARSGDFWARNNASTKPLRDRRVISPPDGGCDGVQFSVLARRRA